jgi:8-oxoguanine deaminase
MFRTDTLSMAGGAVHDPVGALLLCASDNADYTIVNGRVVVRKGEIATVDMEPLIERHNQLAMQLASCTLNRLCFHHKCFDKSSSDGLSTLAP